MGYYHDRGGYKAAHFACWLYGDDAWDMYDK